MATEFYRSGSLGTDTLSDFIFLWGQVTTNGNVTSFRKNFVTSGYQTTSGKTLYLMKMRIWSSGNTSGTNVFKIGYADNDVGLDTATARTNPVMSFGIDDTNTNGLVFNPAIEYPASSSFKGEHLTLEGPIPIAASTKFPFLRTVSDGAARSFFLWCFEQ